MEKLVIGLCEDEEAERYILLARLEGCEIPCEVHAFSDGEGLLDSFYTGRYDLLLVDIYMNGINGVETVSRIRQMDQNVPIAFLTSSLNHAMDGYRFHVDRYLVKPYEADALLEILNFAMRRRLDQPRISLMIGGKRQEIMHRSIRYIEQKGHAALLYLTDGNTYRVSAKISDLALQLPQPPFYACHKSYLVNLSHVRFLNKEMNVFEMSGGGNAYIRRGSQRDAENVYRSFMFRQTREREDRDINALG